MLCEVCNEEEAAFTMIPTGEGLPESIGPVCLARRGLELAKVILPAEEIAATLGPMFVTPAREDLHEDAAKQRKGRKSKAPADAPAAEGEAGGPATQPPAAANE